MKLRAIFFVVVLGASFTIVDGMERSGSHEIAGHPNKIEEAGYFLFKWGTSAAIAWGMSEYFVHGKFLTYLVEYVNLLDQKNASDQLMLLLEAKKALNPYTSPLKSKIVDDLIWLHKSIAEIIKGKPPIDQIKILEEYQKQHMGGKKYSLSLLSQNRWFARYLYCIDLSSTIGKKFFMDEYFDKILAGGFILELYAKNKGLLREVLAKKYNYRYRLKNGVSYEN